MKQGRKGTPGAPLAEGQDLMHILWGWAATTAPVPSEQVREGRVWKESDVLSSEQVQN